MTKKKKDIVHKDLLIRVLEYCYKKGEFATEEIGQDIGLTVEELIYIEKFKSSSGGSKQMFEYTKNRDVIIDGKTKNINGFRLTPTAVFNYLEYVELVEAKKNAISSKKIAIWAIIISLIASIAAISAPFIVQLIKSFQNIG